VTRGEVERSDRREWKASKGICIGGDPEKSVDKGVGIEPIHAAENPGKGSRERASPRFARKSGLYQ